MKSNYFSFISAVLLALLASCSSGDMGLPEGILSKDKMVLVLADVQIAEAVILYKNSHGDMSTEKNPAYYAFIFKKYGITEKQFRESFSYYVSRETEMDNIYEEVLIEISKRQAELSNK